MVVVVKVNKFCFNFTFLFGGHGNLCWWGNTFLVTGRCVFALKQEVRRTILGRSLYD